MRSRKNADEKSRTHIKSRFIRESLVDKQVNRSTATAHETDVLPDVNVIGLGGRSILDQGKKTVFPLVDEIVENKSRHKMILAVSGGIRALHTYAIALDLGIPTGGLAHLAGAAEEQYEKMLLALLAKHGGIQLTKDHYWDIPHKLASGMIPVTICMPPYHFWEQPARNGSLPMNGSDFGLYILAESLGARSVIYVKDVDGIYTKNPRTYPNAKLISKVHPDELLERKLKSSCLEPMVLEVMRNARHVKRVQIINGLKRGNLTRALNLEHVGTIIQA